jgi:hypothetical protein
MIYTLVTAARMGILEERSVSLVELALKLGQATVRTMASIVSVHQDSKNSSHQQEHAARAAKISSPLAVAMRNAKLVHQGQALMVRRPKTTTRPVIAIHCVRRTRFFAVEGPSKAALVPSSVQTVENVTARAPWVKSAAGARPMVRRTPVHSQPNVLASMTRSTVGLVTIPVFERKNAAMERAWLPTQSVPHPIRHNGSN